MSITKEREIKELKDEIERQISIVQKTGKLRYGLRNVIRALQRGEAKAIVVAEKIPIDMKNLIKYYAALMGVPIIEFPGTSAELGTAAKRPHIIAAIAVLDLGVSKLLEYSKEISL
ncbi:MAG: 50S ribosomal protein L30e [Crenarchaeota archaeon]|nr:50S ribosomal protein L30e [Thermoproteota archaeon]MCR8454310.1 50S ribosomal protein L30e [Thermoproteota archaeon]MCR8455078.1 50S ribosomal protein L30e [Thermoproteota archaeon]MCR8470818.1 50S ribosomal protein L30e [Thermoproteota archaeon]MCR8472126.1 50S ribosomal protein L30e [Thermoproteota archaeon]